MDKIKVILHVNKLEKWKHTLGNVSNLIADLNDAAYDIIVLANGESVRYYVENPADSAANKLIDLSKQGVHFKACQNSLKGYKLVPEELYDFVEIVPAGITELVRKQGEGYAYVKP